MVIQRLFFAFSILTGLIIFSYNVDFVKAQQENFDCNKVAEIPKTECEALVTIYHLTDGLNWRKNEYWLITNTPCSWYGVKCEAGHVTALQLINNKLNGTIPGKISDLPNLTELALSQNPHLTGDIPPELGQLIYLEELSLNDTGLSGHIPPELGQLSNLEILSLDYTQLSGNIPRELSYLSQLKHLDLFSTDIDGKIPPEIGNLTKLELLAVGCTELSGNIPPELGQLTNLKYLLFSCYPGQHSRSHFTGPLPQNLVNLKNLEQLWIENGKLCEPGNEEFQSWLSNIKQVNRSGIICDVPAQLPETGKTQSVNFSLGAIKLGCFLLFLGQLIRLLF